MKEHDGVIVFGGDEPALRAARAADTYRTSLRPPEAGKPGLMSSGRSKATPLLDGLLDGQHVVRFKMEPGSRTALHTHDCDQLLIVIAGTGIIASATEEIEMFAGCMVLIPAGEPHIHATRAGEGSQTIAITRTGHSTDIIE